MSLPTVTVAGEIDAPDGTTLTNKTVTFTTTAPMLDAAGNVLVPAMKVNAKVIAGQVLAPNGSDPLVLFASDNGVTTVPYRVRELFTGGRDFVVNLLTADVVGGVIPYSTLGPVDPAPTADSPYAFLSEVESRDADVLAAAEAYTDSHSGAGDVQTVAGVSPVSGDVPEGSLASALGLPAITSGLAAKADSADLTAEVTRAETAEAANAAAISNETARAEGVEAAKADLVSGKVPTSQLPAIPSFTTHSVASQAAMLALSGAAVGDVAIRADTTNARYLLTALPASTLGNWLLIDSDPTAGVDTINGQHGTVVLGAADVGAATSAQGAKADSAVQPGALGTIASRAATDFLAQPSAEPSDGQPGVWSHAQKTFVGGASSQLARTAVKTANYTASPLDLVPVDISGGSWTLKLPNAPADKTLVAYKIVAWASPNALTLSCQGSDVFNKAGGPTSGSVSLGVNQGALLHYDAATAVWTVVADDIPSSILDTRYVQASTATAKGDLLAATASATIARLAVGSDGQKLMGDSTVADGLSYGYEFGPQRIKTGATMYHLFDNGQVQAVAFVLNGLITCPFPVDRPCTVDRIGVNVQAAGTTGAVVRLGIYADDGAGRPGALVLDAGTVGTTSTGFKEITVSQALTPGLYWLGAVAQSVTCTVYGSFNVIHSAKQSSSPSTMLQFSHMGFYQASVSGALPNPMVPIASDGNPSSFTPRITARIT